MPPYLRRASVYGVKDGLSLPHFLGKTILAEEHVDVGIVDVRPRLVTILLVIQENVHYPGVALLKGIVVLLPVIAPKLSDEMCTGVALLAFAYVA